MGILIDALEKWLGMLHWWHRKSPENVNLFLQSGLHTPEGLAVFLRSCSGHVISDRSTFDYVNLKSVEELIPAEELDKTIRSLTRRKSDLEPGLIALIKQFRVALGRRKKGLSVEGSDMARDHDRS